MMINSMYKNVMMLFSALLVIPFLYSECSEQPSLAIQRKLKILIVTTTFPKLSETFVINQVTGLLQRGHDVYVYAQKYEQEKVHEDVRKYNLIMRTYYEDLPADLDTYDIIVCQFGPLGNSFLQVKKEFNLKAKLVTFFRGFDISRYVNAHPDCYSELFKEGDLFITNCQFFRERLLSLGAPAEKTFVHYSSIDCSKFKYSEHSRTDDQTVIITTGRLVEKKGIEDALRALKLVIEHRPNVEYIIIGDGPLKKKLQKLAQELNLQKYITFAGWCTQKEVAEYLKNAHIFLLPCVTARNFDQDAITNVLKEAMACGLPVVSTNHGGVPEGVIDGENGFLVNEHDIEGLAQKIIYLIDHQELWQSFGMKGRCLVEQKFDYKAKNTELEKILLTVTN